MNANTSSASPLEHPGSAADRSVNPTLEPTVDPTAWEELYRRGERSWDKGRAAPPLVDFLSEHPVSGRILVPGCGSGHDVRALAAQGDRAEVVGLDLAPTAVALAQSFPSEGRETYRQGDLFALPESWNGVFDWVVEHTCFCAIPPARRFDYVAAIERVLKPGGCYLAIFYRNPASPEGPPHGVRGEEIAALFDPSLPLLREWLPGRSFEEREGRELCQLRKKRL